MGFVSVLVWIVLGNASPSERVNYLLAVWLWPAAIFYDLESHSSLHHVVFMARTQSESFEDIEMGVADLKIFCFRTLFDWINASGCFSFLSLQDFLDSCNSLNH